MVAYFWSFMVILCMLQHNVQAQEVANNVTHVVDVKQTKDLNKNILDVAKQRYNNSILFKKTRTNRYVKQANTLPPEVQKLLIAQSNNDLAPLTITEQNMKEIDTAISMIRNSQKGVFYNDGDRSSNLVEDLYRLKATLTDKLQRSRAQTAVSGQEYFDNYNKQIEQQKTQAKNDQAARSAQRVAATPAKYYDYLKDNVFEHLNDEQDPVIQPKHVVDEKHLVMTQQIKTLQAKLHELQQQKEAAGYDYQSDFDKQIHDVQAEINLIEHELIQHHDTLLGDTTAHIQKLHNNVKIAQTAAPREDAEPEKTQKYQEEILADLKKARVAVNYHQQQAQ